MSEKKAHYVTLYGIPLGMSLTFPYHRSHGGADYVVLHGRVDLEDGTGLHAPVAVQMSRVVEAAVGGLGEDVAYAPSVNSIRKFTDTKDIEFLKSDKKQPIILNSRMFSMVTKKWTFQNPSDEELAAFLRRKIFWSAKLSGGKAWIADPVEQQYLSRTAGQLLAATATLAAQGMCKVEGEYATASDKLMAFEPEVLADMKSALDEIAAKHAFERL